MRVLITETTLRGMLMADEDRDPAGIVDRLLLYFDHGALGIIVEAMTSDELEEYVKASTA